MLLDQVGQQDHWVPVDQQEVLVVLEILVQPDLEETRDLLVLLGL